MEEATAKIDSFVHGKQSVLSFRRLSDELDVQYCTAQSYLQSYVANMSASDAVTVLWHVVSEENGVSRSELTFTPSVDPCEKSVWAIAPKSLPTELPLWLREDLMHDLSLTQTTTYEANSLRSGSRLSVISPTAVWDSRPDPRLGDAGPPPSLARKSSSLLTNVKSSANSGPKLGKNEPSRNSFFKHKQKPPSATAPAQSLRQRSKNRNQGGERGSISQSNFIRKSGNSRIDRKNRRIISDDSNEEDHVEAAGKHNDRKDFKNVTDIMEEDDSESSQEHDLRAMERERAHEDEAEAERDQRELTLQGDEGPVSPVLKDVDGDEAMGVEAELNVNGKGNASVDLLKGSKRSFFEPSGTSNFIRGARRIRKEVEEQIIQNGYFVTRRVVKTFDENGQEVKSEKSDIVSGGGVPKSKRDEKTVCDNSSNRDGVNASKLDKENGGIGMKNTTSQPKRGKSSAKTSKKRLKGNIGTYFSRNPKS